ncbi:MAG: hypothetical protein OK441_02500 [Thaumarchaeota archaeon]|nr:hypothetical protein [Nitrososphaerota archaeon]
MATKQDTRREDSDGELRQLREDLEERLTAMEEKLSKTMNTERRTLEKEQDVMRELRHRFKAAGERVSEGVDRADDMVKDHPVLVVGGALAVGLALGALLTSRRRD